MPDFTKYQPPGVYVEEDVTTLVAPAGVRPTVVALVGPARGYRQATESVTLTGAGVVQLGQLGIDTASVVVAAADGTVHPATDYSLTPGGGADTNLATPQDNTVSITRNGAGIPDGATVYVSYNYTDAAYFMPQSFNDFDDVKAVYGEPLDTTTGAITSPLSFGAMVAFQNGAQTVLLVATAGASNAVTRAQLQAGLDALTGNTSANIIVPIIPGITGTTGAPGDSLNVATDLQTHVEMMSANTYYRIGIIGYDAGVTELPDAIAASFRSARMILAWPNRLNYFNGFANADIEVGGYYLAAAYAGMLANLDVQVPLTHKTVRGFSGIPATALQTMTLAAKNAWSDAGVSVTELTKDDSLVVRHGTTTMRDSVNTREISLVRAKDALVNLIEATINRAGLVGSPIDATTPYRVKGVIAGCLETAVASDIIVGYRNLKVRPNPTGDPSVIEVKFEYDPAYPLNYISVSFSINTTTGDNTIAALAA